MLRSLIFAFCLAPAPALADRVTDRGTFVGLVGGKALTGLGVRMTVTPDGGIGGRAFGRDVTGTWTWADGFFCRTMRAGDRRFDRNCQVVEHRGDRLRFIADRGKGAVADLRLQ